MSENPFLTKIAEIAKRVMSEDVAPLVEKLMDERVEKHLDEVVPVIVAKELHRILNGEKMGKPGPQEPEYDENGDPVKADGGRGGRAGHAHGGGRKKKLGPRPRCPKCGAAMAKSGCKKCK